MQASYSIWKEIKKTFEVKKSLGVLLLFDFKANDKIK
jgi:hypothetical protein